MSTADRPSRATGTAADVCLALIFAAGLVLTAFMLIASWGGAFWVFGAATGSVMAALALARGWNRAVTALAGLAVSAAAVGIAPAADLPREPGPVASLALAVLIGSAVRRLSARTAVPIAAAGLVLAAHAWRSEPDAVAGWAVLCCSAAIATGLALRHDDHRRPGRRP